MFCLIVKLVTRALFVLFYCNVGIPHMLFVLWFARSVLFDCDVGVSRAFRLVFDVHWYLVLPLCGLILTSVLLMLFVFDCNINALHFLCCVRALFVLRLDEMY